MARQAVRWILVFAALVASGCANLKEVREFAGESARLAAYRDLSVRFRDTYQRERPYLFGEAERIAQENDAARKEIYQDLVRLQDNVMLYMATLATIAGDDAFDLAKGIDGLAKGIKAHPDLGLDAKHVDAFASLAKIVAKWATSAYQQHAIREMVREGAAPLQATLAGLGNVVRYYRKTSANERKSVLGFFDVEKSFADTPKDRLLLVLARAHFQGKAADYDAAEAKYAELEKGIGFVADGHAKLLANVNKLSGSEARAQLAAIAKDLKTIRGNLQALQQ